MERKDRIYHWWNQNFQVLKNKLKDAFLNELQTFKILSEAGYVLFFGGACIKFIQNFHFLSYQCITLTSIEDETEVESNVVESILYAWTASLKKID